MGIAAAAKAAVIAVKNKGNLRKAVIAIILMIMTPFLLFAMCFMEIMSAFQPDGVLKSAEYINAEETAIYQSLQENMASYYENLYEELADKRDETIERYTVIYTDYEEVVDEETGEVEIETDYVVIRPTVMRRLNYIPQNLMIAYLLVNDAIETKTGKINQEKLYSFLSAVSAITCSTEKTEEGTEIYWVENELLTIGEIADLYFTDEAEKKQFLITCEAYGEYFDVAQSKIIAEDGEELLVGNIVESLSNVPLYLQYDAAWGNIPYGNGTIKKNGCCPTCLAMVFSYFRGETIYPDNITAWSGNRYYVTGAGTSWGIFEPAGRQWGVNCTNIGKNQEQMRQALSSGKLIIASMGPGTFTKGGHFIVLTGITETGKIGVNDPNDSSIKKHSQTEFEMSLILRECKNMWVFG